MAMKVVVTKSYDESCAYVADMICKLVNEKPACKLGHRRHPRAHV
mgnify:CR=1 FL=1